MECRFCADGKAEEVGQFKACSRCAVKTVPLCNSLVREVSEKLFRKGWSVEVLAFEKDWLSTLESAVEDSELNDEARKAVLFAIRCTKGHISSVTFIDRLSVLAATSAAVSRGLLSSRHRMKREGPSAVKRK